ncbi:putative kinase-like protein TMKL1 [Acorus gramineus]|uniref:Kinase-like protein TMKL1 n=1 Tax=Acorus gramineus TaxID=55184 RepID=A0AAV9AQ89_ACOGR|nr:putative kinase-like protein TMKL1 [Acorus gramineus]
MASTLLTLFTILSILTNPSSSQSPDVSLLLTKIKPSLQGNSSSTTNIQLSTWNLSTPLCAWRGLQWSLSDGDPLNCDVNPARTNLSLSRDPSLSLLSLRLPASGLSGSIPPEIGRLSSLQSLFLGVNSLVGPIPLELGNAPSISAVDLTGNLLSGPLPPSIWNLCNRLVSLRLHHNNLSGSLPSPALPNSTCPNLQVLDLGENGFRGDLPSDFATQFTNLTELDLGSNSFSGSFPPSLLGLNSLQKLNLSFNNFTGSLPATTKFGAAAFQRSGLLIGSGNGVGGGSRLSSGAVAGIVIGLMAGIVVLASVSIGLVQRRKAHARKQEEGDEAGEQEDDGRDGRLVVFQGGEHLTLEEVLNATGQVMEKTSYGTVYKAKLADGGTIALRLLREGSCRDGASCLPVVRQLGRARHENLVALRAFYQGERGEKLLIYDYLPNKTLHELLHETRGGKTMLSWPRRHKIALGVARGLAHLHMGQETPIVHGNVRSKNILVDEFFVARITEYGLDKLMVPTIADEIVSAAKSDGYKAPELQKMKRCSPRTDVYSFGILLLEILLGKKPGRDARTGETLDLPSLVKAAVLEETTMEVFDVELLKGIRSPMEEGLVQALKLAMGCCAPVDSVRPDMGEVVKQLEENRPRNRSALYSPAEIRSEIGTPRLG